MMGLEKLHEHHIMHRDVKLDNLFIKGEILKIGDLGFSSTKSFASSFLGTPTNLPPEFLQMIKVEKDETKQENKRRLAGNAFLEGEIVYDKNIDVWASGICLYQMVFGEHPYQIELSGEFEADIENLKQKTFAEKDIFANKKVAISADLKFVLSKMLEKDKKKRYSFSALRQTEWYVDGLIKWTSKLNSDLEIEKTMDSSIHSSFVNFKSEVGRIRKRNLVYIEAFKKMKDYIYQKEVQIKFLTVVDSLLRDVILLLEGTKEYPANQATFDVWQKTVLLFLAIKMAMIQKLGLLQEVISKPQVASRELGIQLEIAESLVNKICKEDLERKGELFDQMFVDQNQKLGEENELIQKRNNFNFDKNQIFNDKKQIENCKLVEGAFLNALNPVLKDLSA